MGFLRDRMAWVLRGQGGTAATIQTFLVRILIMGLNLATGVLTARFLGSAGRGEQAAILMWGQLLGYMMTLGLPASVMYYFKKRPTEQAQILGAAVLMGLALSSVAVIVGIVGIPIWLKQYSSTVIQVAQFGMIAVPIGLTSTLIMAALDARGEFNRSNHLRYLSPLTTLAGIVIFILIHQLNPITSAIAYIVPSSVMSLWVTKNVIARIGFSIKNLIQNARSLVSYGIRSYGIDIFNVLSMQIDQALIVWMLSPKLMGMYSVALSISRLINIFQTSIVTVLFPKVAAAPVEEIVAMVGLANRISILMTTLVGSLMFAGVPYLLTWVYGSEFAEAATVTRWMLVEVVLGGSVWILSQAFMAVGYPGMVTLFQGVGLGAMVPLLLLLVPRWGLEGAGVALLLSTSLRLMFVLCCFPWVLKAKPPRFWMTQQDVLVLQKRLVA